MNQQNFWDGVADKYSRDKISDLDAYEFTLERVQSYLSKRDKVIELGAGTSSTALRLAPFVHQYLSTDGSAEMVRIGREKLAQTDIENLEIDTSNFENDAFAGAEFDAVLAFNVLHLVPDIEAALGQVKQMLRPGGLFISKTPCLGSHPKALKKALIKTAIPVMQWVGKAPSPVHMPKVAELDALIAAAGFEIIETGNYPASAPSRFVVGRYG